VLYRVWAGWLQIADDVLGFVLALVSQHRERASIGDAPRKAYSRPFCRTPLAIWQSLAAAGCHVAAWRRLQTLARRAEADLRKNAKPLQVGVG
jgi:hypothetical protein